MRFANFHTNTMKNKRMFAFIDGDHVPELDKITPPQWRYLFNCESPKSVPRERSTFATRSAMFKRGFVVGARLTDAGKRALRVEWRATP